MILFSLTRLLYFQILHFYTIEKRTIFPTSKRTKDVSSKSHPWCHMTRYQIFPVQDRRSIHYYISHKQPSNKEIKCVDACSIDRNIEQITLNSVILLQSSNKQCFRNNKNLLCETLLLI